MAFTQEVNITKDGIEDFEIILFVPGPGSIEEIQTGKINVQILMSDETFSIVSFDLLARLQDDAEGQTHLANLVALRNYIRIRLNSEVLPE